MTWIVLMGALVVVFLACYFIAKFLRNSRNSDYQDAVRMLGKSAPAAVIVLALAGTVWFSTYQIPAGHVGVVYEFGAIRTQIGEGLQFIVPWRSAKMANIQVQRHIFDKMESFSQETQTVFVKASLNVNVSPQAIQELYRTVGPQYFNVLVEPRVHQNFKDEMVKYKTVDIAPNRETIRRSVRERLEKELSSHSIKVEDLLLDNIDFHDSFEQAIEAKQIATQKALEEEQKIVVERHRAAQAVEKARGEGSALFALAEKQAEANQKLSASLTPQLIQYTMIQKLAPDIRVMILPSGQNFILDSDMFKNLQEKK